MGIFHQVQTTSLPKSLPNKTGRLFLLVYTMRFCCFFLLLTSWLTGCRPTTRFERLDARETGIDFANTIAETDSLNVLEFEYIYNGGGVGVGDFNGDGQTDVFFAGNRVSSRLYLNKGDFYFRDATQPAGVQTAVWCTGVAVMDINADDRLDIYVSVAHPKLGQSSPNLLFINQGNDKNGVPRFREMAGEIGLADVGYSTQAAFLDYDRDGDLDVFLLTNALEAYNRNDVTGPRNDGSARSRDKLFRNESGPNKPVHFSDVSLKAGITHEGWGLGIIVNDINQDGWPDVYTANDFQSNDVLYINNRDGTFSNQIGQALRHQSHNSMGVDMADINNDGLNDLTVVDMLPSDNRRQKAMFSNIPYDRFQLARRLGYQPQYVRNVLQLNRGFASNNDSLPVFSDIGQLAGISATDWSWSALLADFDNDGFRDLLVTNGYRRDVTDLDFLTYSQDGRMFGTDADRRSRLRDHLESLEPVHKASFLFQNNHDLTFTNRASEWGLDTPAFTNGTAYADFDNDGDLDLVMNNLDGPATVYRNRTCDRQSPTNSASNYLRISLRGTPANQIGIGAKVALYYGGQMQYAEQVTQRGYLSTVEPFLHFGLGTLKQVDSLKVWWPNGQGQVLYHVAVNQQLTLMVEKAMLQPPSFSTFIHTGPSGSELPLLEEVSARVGLRYQHEEDDFVDYKSQQTLLPHKHSQIGPGLGVGDLNGDGWDDLYIGGPAGKGGTIFYQQFDGTFRRTTLAAKAEEETGVLLFDADNDGDLDVYTVYGSTEFGQNTSRYKNRLLLNDGHGHLRADTTALPLITASGSCVRGADFDQDGDIDLFVGGRVVPQQYPKPARSYVLQNNGGRFSDVTARLAPDLETAGLVCDALWTDYDNDGRIDLLVTGEFMPITFYRNRNGRFEKGPVVTCPDGKSPALGWWNSLSAGDFDNDGDTDYIGGNNGMNGRYRTSVAEPVTIYADDYDQNGTLDPIMTQYADGNEYPVHFRETLTDQIPQFRRSLPTYAAYGQITIGQLLPAVKRKSALVLQANTFASVYIENQGSGRFVSRSLPVMAQVSPIFGMQPTDLNNDGLLDLLLIGNDYAADVLTGWLDAGLGLALLGNGKGAFCPLTPAQSGLLVKGDAKALARLTDRANRSLYIASQNQDSLRVFRSRQSPATETIHLRPDDQSALMYFSNGRSRKIEFYWGASYLAQSSRAVTLPVGVTSVQIRSRSASRTVRIQAQ